MQHHHQQQQQQKQDADPSPEGSLSQKVGQMAEESQKAADQQEQVIRGDGTVLPHRAPDEPGNPKKRMMEGESGNVYKRDEL